MGKREAQGGAEGVGFFSSLWDFHYSWNRWVISLISLPSSDENEEASESDSELSDVSPFAGGGSRKWLFFLLNIFNMCTMHLSDLILSLGQNKYRKTGFWKLRS